MGNNHSKDNRRINTSTLGGRIESQRILVGMTQEDLASEVGCSSRTIGRYETIDDDSKLPKVAVLEKLAIALGVDVNWLLLGEDYVEEIPDKQPKTWWTEEEAMEVLGVSKDRLMQLKLVGTLEPRKTNPDRYLREDLLGYQRMKSRSVNPVLDPVIAVQREHYIETFDQRYYEDELLGYRHLWSEVRDLDEDERARRKADDMRREHLIAAIKKLHDAGITVQEGLTLGLISPVKPSGGDHASK